MIGAGLAAEAKAAGLGLGRLIRGDPAWAGGFDTSPAGFVRSFAGPCAVLPLVVANTLLYLHAQDPGTDLVGAALDAGLSHALDLFGFPLVVGLLGGWLWTGRGYGAFVVAGNWAAVYLNLVLTALSPLALLGEDGAGVFGMAALVVLAASLALVWRIARATLTRELGPLVLITLLSLGWSILADELVRRLCG